VKVAVIHDWLTVYSGAETVLEQLLELYPDADIFTLFDFLPSERRAFLRGHEIKTSFLQEIPFAKKYYRYLLSLMPLAIEQFDLSEYDLVISSSHAVAKGVITGPNQVHISYVHSPMRYVWDLHAQYLRDAGLSRGVKSWLARWQLHRIRLWDYRTSAGVDYFIANSNFIAKRIRKTYGRNAQVIYPPVGIDSFGLCDKKQNYYVTAQRMVPYKKVLLIVEAFAKMPDKKLLVLGDGPDMEKIKAAAKTPNIEILGYQERTSFVKIVQEAKAFVFAAEEDFGIAPVEAQACGTPVIAYGAGGALETVRNGKTGLFFKKQTVESLVETIGRFEAEGVSFSPSDIRQSVLSFSEGRFKDEFMSVVSEMKPTQSKAEIKLVHANNTLDGSL